MPGAQGRITIRRRPKDGTDGRDGEDAYLLDLDNEVQGIACDATGAVLGASPYATTNATVYRGGSVDKGWTYSLDLTGCHATYQANAQTGICKVEVDSMSADTASVIVKADKDGKHLTAVMSLYKAKPGATGQPATVYSIETSASVLHKAADGTVTPAKLGLYKRMTVGGNPPSRTNTKVLRYQLVGASANIYTLADYGGEVTIPADCTSVKVWLYDTDGTTLLDSESVPVVCDGAKGDNGNDAVSVIVSPMAVVYNPSNGNKIYTVNITLRKGGVNMTWNNPSAKKPNGSGWTEGDLHQNVWWGAGSTSGTIEIGTTADSTFVGDLHLTVKGSDNLNYSVAIPIQRVVDGENGTSVTIAGRFKNHYGTQAQAQAAYDALTIQGKSGFDTHIVDTATDGTHHWVAKSVISHTTFAPSLTFTQAELGKGYIKESDGHLWIAVEDGWQDVGQIKGDKGEPGNDGKPGEDAVSVLVSSHTVTYNPADPHDELVMVSLRRGTAEVPWRSVTARRGNGGATWPEDSEHEHLKWYTDDEDRGIWFEVNAQTTFSGVINFTFKDADLNEYPVSIAVVHVADGLQGCIYRTTEWAEGIEFHNDSALRTAGLRYIDLATVKNPALPEGAEYYLCRLTHISSGTNSPAAEFAANPGLAETEHWEKVNEKAPIRTPLIIAQNAVLTFLQGNQIIVMKNDGTTVNAAMGGGPHPLWIGAVNAADAPFSVAAAGSVRATDGYFAGAMTVQALSLGAERLPDNLYTDIPDDEPLPMLTQALNITAGGHFMLPALPAGTSRVIEILVIGLPGSLKRDQTLSLYGNDDPAHPLVKITVECDLDEARHSWTFAAKEDAQNGIRHYVQGVYRCLGWCVGSADPLLGMTDGLDEDEAQTLEAMQDVTYWNVVRMDNATEAVMRLAGMIHSHTPSRPGMVPFYDHIEGDCVKFPT